MRLTDTASCSGKEERMGRTNRENSDIFDFTLSEEKMGKTAA